MPWAKPLSKPLQNLGWCHEPNTDLAKAAGLAHLPTALERCFALWQSAVCGISLVDLAAVAGPTTAVFAASGALW